MFMNYTIKNNKLHIVIDGVNVTGIIHHWNSNAVIIEISSPYQNLITGLHVSDSDTQNNDEIFEADRLIEMLKFLYESGKSRELKKTSKQSELNVTFFKKEVIDDKSLE
jgi:hypothetical protein